jgi:hypothetical protein
MKVSMTNYPAARARGLWLKVVAQALRDALSGAVDANAARARRRAHEWLVSGGNDFREVCDLAGICPRTLRDRYQAGLINLDALEAAWRPVQFSK